MGSKVMSGVEPIKTAAIFATSLIWLSFASGTALASDCETDKITLEVEMTALNLHVADMKGVTAQIEAANGSNDGQGDRRLQKELAQSASKVVEIATEVLYIIESMDRDSTNCGLSQTDLGELHAQMTRIVSVGKKIVQDGN